MKIKSLLLLVSLLVPVLSMATPEEDEKAARMAAFKKKQQELALVSEGNAQIMNFINMMLPKLKDESEKLVAVMCICAEADYLRSSGLTGDVFVAQCQTLGAIVERDFLAFFEVLEKELIAALIAEILEKSTHTKIEAAQNAHKKTLLFELINLSTREQQKNALTNGLKTEQDCMAFVTQLSAVYEVLMMNFKAGLLKIVKPRIDAHTSALKAKKETNPNEKTPSI